MHSAVRVSWVRTPNAVQSHADMIQCGEVGRSRRQCRVIAQMVRCYTGVEQIVEIIVISQQVTGKIVYANMHIERRLTYAMNLHFYAVPHA